MCKYLIVELSDGTVTSTPSTKFLASKMKIIEECDEVKAGEKVLYWDRIYHYTPEMDEDKLKHHFFDRKHNKHIWSNSPDKAHLRGHRHWKDYELVESLD